jgi:NAD(P)H-hydrate epimerase
MWDSDTEVFFSNYEPEKEIYLQTVIQTNIPALTTEQMNEVDRLMTDCYGITLTQMMENAGRNLAKLTRKMLGGDIQNRKICVFTGSGNNGGGGLVAARHLSNWGAEVTVILSTPADRLKPIPEFQLEIIRHLPISVVKAGSFMKFIEWNSCNFIIDAIFGYGLNREPAGLTAKIIKKINDLNCQVLSLDAPSGLDTSSGTKFEHIVEADATLTLALPKTGLLTPEAKKYMGKLYIGDISVPPILYSRLGVEVNTNLFARNAVVRY